MLRSASPYVTTTHITVLLIPLYLRALPLEIFTKSSIYETFKE